jgi:hypothetical protein
LVLTFVAEKASTKKTSSFRRAGSGDGNDDDDGGDLLAGMGFGSEMSGSASGNQPKSKLDELLGKNASVSEGELHSFCFT